MEKARPLIAIAVCFAIWGAYFLWFSPKAGEKAPAPPTVPGAGEMRAKDPDEGAKPPPDPGPEKPPDPGPEKPPDPPVVEGGFVHPQVAPATVTLETGTIALTLTTAGASIQRLVLVAHKDPFDHRAPLILLDEWVPGFRSLALRDMSGATRIETEHWEVLPTPPTEAAFRYTTPDGLRLVKTYRLGPEAYAVRMTLEVENLSKAPLARWWELIGVAGIEQEASGGVYPAGAHGLSKEGKAYAVELDDLDLKEISEKPWTGESRGIPWVGATNKFYAAVLAPQDPAAAARYSIYPVNFTPALLRKLEMRGIPPGDKRAAEYIDWTTNTLGTSASLAERTWQAGEKTSTEWILYAGPKDGDALAEGRFSEWRIGDLLDFGWFGFISRILLWIMAALYAVFRNWGVSIIVMVLIVRLCIYPISKKAQVSMFRMSKLQPRIKELQERFKGEPAKQNEAVMGLMREEGVTPLGGCLPMFLQLPIFLGLYNALMYDIHLRQQPFLFWITDLSQPETLFHLPFTVFGQNGFHLLPLIMTITWFIQAYLAPRSPDPQMAAQQKIFMFMPLVIGFMMYSSPSGLVLYWLISTAWGIAEQQYIKRRYLK
ncbi:MAG: membrane protein insertase YidC [Candidatus Brocadiae bacterium]|nr:membrane protein insertase YidC [Candidatus Brocadiia bacterium]